MEAFDMLKEQCKIKRSLLMLEKTNIEVTGKGQSPVKTKKGDTTSFEISVKEIERQIGPRNSVVHALKAIDMLPSDI